MSHCSVALNYWKIKTKFSSFFIPSQVQCISCTFLWQGSCLKYLLRKTCVFFFFRAHSNLNLRVTFIWLSTINKCYMMGNLQAALLLLIMRRLLMLSYALNPHQRKILPFLYTPHMLLCFRFVLLN